MKNLHSLDWKSTGRKPNYKFLMTTQVTSPPSKVSVWNSLPDSLRDPAVGLDQFRRDLSDIASRLAHCFRVMRYTNRHFTYLLTYLLIPHEPP